MATTRQHVYQVLTTRPKRARQLLRGWTPPPGLQDPDDEPAEL
jgi:protein gp37